jgi:hypothetical protein
MKKSVRTPIRNTRLVPPGLGLVGDPVGGGLLEWGVGATGGWSVGWDVGCAAYAILVHELASPGLPYIDGIRPIGSPCPQYDRLQDSPAFPITNSIVVEGNVCSAARPHRPRRKLPTSFIR